MARERKSNRCVECGAEVVAANGIFPRRCPHCRELDRDYFRSPRGEPLDAKISSDEEHYLAHERRTIEGLFRDLIRNEHGVLEERHKMAARLRRELIDRQGA